MKACAKGTGRIDSGADILESHVEMFDLLTMSATKRVGLALGVCTLLWLAMMWAG